MQIKWNSKMFNRKKAIYFWNESDLIQCDVKCFKNRNVAARYML